MERQPTIRRHICDTRVHGTLGKHMATTELNVNRLTATLSSNFRARLQQATAGYNCNQGHEWIEHDM